jgi:hypothetical protein
VIISTFAELGYDFGEKTPTWEMILTAVDLSRDGCLIGLKKRFGSNATDVSSFCDPSQIELVISGRQCNILETPTDSNGE